MKKIIQLGTDKTARLLDKEPFLLPDFLEIEFKSIGYDLSNAFLILQNGEKKEKFKFTNPFTVPQEFLFAGRLNIQIDSYYKGLKVKSWTVYPIKIEEVDGGISIFDEMDELWERVKKLEKEINIDF